MSRSRAPLQPGRARERRTARNELIRVLIASIDGEAEDTPEAIARTWDTEIDRRIADFEAGRTVGVPAEQVLAEVRAMIAGRGKP